MKTYRISKYNPAKRNSKGHYTELNEWTSISDIGKPKYGNISFQEYFDIENAYCAAIDIISDFLGEKVFILQEVENRNNQESLTLDAQEGYLKGLPKNIVSYILGIQENKIVPIAELHLQIRLCLREIIWGKYLGARMHLRFGYDYYMYVDTDFLPDHIIKKIQAHNLFVD